MDHTNENTVSTAIASLVKRCPCCASRGVLTEAPSQSKFGAECNGCPLTFPEVYITPESAITAWSLRRGTVSAAGGRKTRGKCSWRKRRSCRRNLRSARERRKVKQLKTRLLVQIPWLHALRAYDQAESSEEKARTWAALMAMAPQIGNIPSLRSLFKKMRGYGP